MYLCLYLYCAPPGERELYFFEIFFKYYLPLSSTIKFTLVGTLKKNRNPASSQTICVLGSSNSSSLLFVADHILLLPIVHGKILHHSLMLIFTILSSTVPTPLPWYSIFVQYRSDSPPLVFEDLLLCIFFLIRTSRTFGPDSPNPNLSSVATPRLCVPTAGPAHCRQRRGRHVSRVGIHLRDGGGTRIPLLSTT